jgi:hypothetical protein
LVVSGVCYSDRKLNDTRLCSLLSLSKAGVVARIKNEKAKTKSNLSKVPEVEGTEFHP